MNVNIIICGIPKDYILLIDNLKSKLKGYQNLDIYIITNEYHECFKNLPIKKFMIVKDKYDNSYRNALNY